MHACFTTLCMKFVWFHLWNASLMEHYYRQTYRFLWQQCITELFKVLHFIRASQCIFAPIKHRCINFLEKLNFKAHVYPKMWCVWVWIMHCNQCAMAENQKCDSHCALWHKINTIQVTMLHVICHSVCTIIHKVNY